MTHFAASIRSACLLAAALAAAGPAAASDRYSQALRYVDTTGVERVAGSGVLRPIVAPQVVVLQPVPALRPVPPVAAPAVRLAVRPAPLPAIRPAIRPPVRLQAAAGADWADGRKCCRPGQAYFDDIGEY